ncbi:hypothetical protein B0H13DRAFT_1858778 [Mycena leptocephala]|nr:hypothetical protein B0H13DRAFT_1858778 [Mycena leptocephala]
MSQCSHLSEPDLEVAALLSLAILPDLGQLTPADIPCLRPQFVSAVIPQIMERYRLLLPPDSQYTVEDQTIAVDAGEICIRAIMLTMMGDQSPKFLVMASVKQQPPVAGYMFG